MAQGEDRELHAPRRILIPAGPLLEEELALLLRRQGAAASELRFTLDELSLLLGRRLPDVAQTMTYWQRGTLGRIVRRAGFDVQVELGHVVFVRPNHWRALLPSTNSDNSE